MTFYLLDVQPVVAGRITRCTLRVVLIRENCRNSVALSLQQLPADISFDRSVSRKKYPHKQSPVSIGQSVFSRTRLNISSVTFGAGLVIEAVSGSILVGPVRRSPIALPTVGIGGILGVGWTLAMPSGTQQRWPRRPSSWCLELFGRAGKYC